MSTLATSNLKNASATNPNIVLNTDGTIGGDCLTQTCRAWVNFNGTGTVAIRASYNVSSITDNNTGDYTVNFTTAFADANYNVASGAGRTSTSPADSWVLMPYTYTTGSLKVLARFAGQTTDLEQANIAVFR